MIGNAKTFVATLGKIEGHDKEHRPQMRFFAVLGGMTFGREGTGVMTARAAPGH